MLSTRLTGFHQRTANKPFIEENIIKIMDKNEVLKEYFAEIGKKGGKSKSPAKMAAMRRNTKKAGRRRIPDEYLTVAQRKRRDRYEASKAKNKDKENGK